MTAAATAQTERPSAFTRVSRSLAKPDTFVFSKVFFACPGPMRRALGRLLYSDAFHALVNIRYKLAKGLLPRLSPVGERVVADLRRDGIAFCHVSELGLQERFDGLKAEFEGLIAEWEANPESKAGPGSEDYIIRLGGPTVLRGDDAVSRFLSEGQLAAISGRYLDLVPRFVGRYIWRTLPIARDERVSSQRWHRDYEDTHISKIFLYMNDIAVENGPTEFVKTSNKLGKLGGLAPGRALDEKGLRKYPTDAELAPYAQELEKNRVTCTAKAGTLIFVDTFGFHRGGFCKEGRRDMMIFHFATAANLHHVGYSIEEGFSKPLSKFLRLVFGVKG